MSLESKWKNLKPSQKRNVVLGGVGAGLIILFYLYGQTASTEDPAKKRQTKPAKPDVTILMGRDTKEVGMDIMLAKINLLESSIQDLKRRQSQVEVSSNESQNSGTLLPYEGGSDLVTLPGVPVAGKTKQTGPNQRNNGTPTTSAFQPIKSANPAFDQPASIDLTPIEDNKKAEPFIQDKPNMPPTSTPEELAALRSTPSQGASKIKGLGGRSTSFFSKDQDQNNQPSLPNDVVASNDPTDPLDYKQPAKKRPVFTGISHGPKDGVSDGYSGRPKTKTPSAYIPPGSMITGVLVTGIDAPTNTSARQEPLPALFRIKHEAILPNYNLLDIRECFMLLAAYGDMSSERSYIRSESLSCVTNNGGIIDTRIDAYATGEDGKAGLRGRLVTKAGSVIAKATLAGFLEGVAGIFRPQRVQQLNTNPGANQQIQFPDPANAAAQGVLSGAETSAKLISEYYLDVAKNLFPVIEIDAGRKIDFILTKGVSLTPRSLSEIASQPDPQSLSSQVRAGANNATNAVGGLFSSPPMPNSYR